MGMKIIEKEITTGELREMARRMFGDLVKAVVDTEKEKIEGEDWIEFDSMINLRPSVGNLSRGVDSPKVKKKIREIVNKLVKR